MICGCQIGLEQPTSYYYHVTSIIIMHCLVPPNVTTTLHPSEPIVVAGSTRTLTCLPQSGDLPFAFHWTRSDGVILSNSSRLVVDFMTDREFGRYTCTAINPYGRGNSSILILRAGNS